MGRRLTGTMQKLEKLFQLPASFKLQKAKVLLLRITIPSAIYSSPIVVEVDGVVAVCIRRTDAVMGVGRMLMDDAVAMRANAIGVNTVETRVSCATEVGSAESHSWV